MKTGRIYLLVAALCLALPACTLVDDAEPDQDVYEGIYTQGIEDSTFEPCGRDEVWNITAGDDAAMRDFIARVTDVVGRSNPMFARLRGAVSAKGRYDGIFITYDRVFELTDVVDVRPLRDSDCR